VILLLHLRSTASVFVYTCNNVFERKAALRNLDNLIHKSCSSCFCRRFFLYRESASLWRWRLATKTRNTTSRRTATTTTTTTSAPGRQTNNDETSKIPRVLGLRTSSQSVDNDKDNNKMTTSVTKTHLTTTTTSAPGR